MDAALFQRFREIAHRQAGIDLRPGKEILLGTRIAKRIRALGLSDEAEYLAFLERDESGEELVRFLDVISTNFTSFFREADHFETIAAHVRERLAHGQRRFRFWSAACSSGEEPYSLAIVLAELCGDPEIDWRILATDISTGMLERAQAAVYGPEALARVPRHLRERHFEEVEGGMRVRPTLRERVVFKRLNLALPPFPMHGPIDAVLCRNVMIYFDKAVRQRLVREIERLLAPGGLLLTGHAESLSGLATSLTVVRPSVYVKQPTPTRRPSRRGAR